MATCSLVPSNPSIETFDSGMLSPPTMWGHPDAMHAARLSHTGPIYMRHGSAGRFATITTAGVLCRARYNVHAAALDDGGGGTRIHPAVTPAEHWCVDAFMCMQRKRRRLHVRQWHVCLHRARACMCISIAPQVHCGRARLPAAVRLLLLQR